MNRKNSKEVVREGLNVRHYKNHREHEQSVDPENKEYIRPARNKNNLPSSLNAGTKLIDVSKFKSWKNRSKVKHQWEHHKKSPNELNNFENMKWDKKQFIFNYNKNCKENEWFEIPIKKIKTPLFNKLAKTFKIKYKDLEKDPIIRNLNDDNYIYVNKQIGEVAEKLVNEGVFEGEWFYWNRQYYNPAGEVITKEMKLLLKVKMI